MVSPPVAHPAVLALKAQGDKAYATRDYASAIERYSEALEGTEDAVVLSNRSATYAQRRRFDKALADADKALRLQPHWPRLHHRRGHALFHLGHYTEAIRAFEAGLKLDPEDSTLRDALAMAGAYTELDPDAPPPERRPKKAAGGSPAAGAATPGEAARAGSSQATSASAEELRQKGNDLFRSGKYSGAMRAYSEALERCSTDPKIWANRAAAQMEMLKDFGKRQTPAEMKTNPYYQNSMGDLERSLSIDPVYVKAWARKGQLLSMASEVRQALAAYERGLKVEPQNPDCLVGKASCEKWLLS